MRWFLLVLVAMLGGCTQFVFVKYGGKLAPEVQGTGQCPIDKDRMNSVEALTAWGDQLRDELLAGHYVVAPASLASGREVFEHIFREDQEAHAWLAGQYKIWRDAQACYERANSLTPKSYAYLSEAVMSLHLSDLSAGDVEKRAHYLQKARDMLASAQALNNSGPQLTYYKAEIQFRMDNLDAAQALLERLSGGKHRSANIPTLLGRILELKGQPAEALAQYKLAEELDQPAASIAYANRRVKVLQAVAPAPEPRQLTAIGTWSHERQWIEDIVGADQRQAHFDAINGSRP